MFKIILYARALLHKSDNGVIKLPELQDDYKILQNKVQTLTIMLTKEKSHTLIQLLINSSPFNLGTDNVNNT
jgi:hypothetical protein